MSYQPSESLHPGPQTILRYACGDPISRSIIDAWRSADLPYAEPPQPKPDPSLIRLIRTLRHAAWPDSQILSLLSNVPDGLVATAMAGGVA